MAALIVGGIALGVDKIKAHRAKGKEKAAARAAAAEESASSAPTLNAQRPGIEKRGRRGYTEYHTPTLASTAAGQSSSAVHPAERGAGADADADGGQYVAAATQGGDGTQGQGSEFVDDEKERLRRFYEERDRLDGQGMRGRASEDLRRGLPAYEDEAQAVGAPGVSAGGHDAPPPSYEHSNATAGR